MTDMRKFIQIAESTPIEEVLDPVTIMGGIAGATAAGIGARAGFTGYQFKKTLRMQEAAQLYHVKKWSIEQIVHKYWPRVKPDTPKYEKLSDKVKQWVVWRGYPLRPGDERASWKRPDGETIHEDRNRK